MREIGLEDVAVQLAYAKQVVFVPGYGMATAQAQHTVRELADILEKRGRQRSSMRFIRWRAACRAT